MTVRAKRTTMIDVARLAGVSTKTVSRVLNSEPYVTAAVRERVEAAAKQLNYHPHVLAQGLVRRRSYLIGLVYENPSPSYVVELQMGVLERLKNERYRLMVIPVQSVRERGGEIVSLLRSAAIDGVVLGPPASDHPAVLEELAAIGMPHARIAPTRMLAGGGSNLLDDIAAAREMAAYVIGLGHRDIAIIKGDPTHPASEARLIGYSQAFAEAGIQVRLERIEQGLFTFDSGFAAARRLFAGSDRPTAILAQNDDMAVGALVAAREAGLDVPGQLSIVGFDDSAVARTTWPQITTIRQPVFEMAAAAADMVITALEDGVVPADRVHPHELIVRSSAAPPPARD